MLSLFFNISYNMISLTVISSIVVFLRLSQATNVSKNYNAKPEFDDKKSDDDLLGDYKAHSLCECSAMCQDECNFYGYHSKLKRCRVHKKSFNSSSGMSDETGWRHYSRLIPTDCKEFRDNGHTTSGVYVIYPYMNSDSPVRVYCNMEVMEGGWTAVQKRVNGSLSFDRNWTEYKNGFGAPEQDYWIGNDVIHQLTKEKDCFLYVSITLLNGTTLYELYEKVTVSDEAGKYRILLETAAMGTLGDSLARTDSIYKYKYATTMYFSTKDRDNDYNSANIAKNNGGGWWFNAFKGTFLNGRWATAGWTYPWYPTITSGSSVTETVMMIKPH